MIVSSVFMRAKRRLPTAVVAVVASLALAGCGAVGKGVEPVSMVLVPTGGTIGDTSTTVFQCFPANVNAILRFSDQSTGDFTGRVQWSSSDPSVVEVSNRDIPVPGSTTNQTYVRGTLVPLQPGTATITATYVKFSASLKVTVEPSGTLTIDRVDQAHYNPVGSSGISIGAGTTQALAVTGDFGGLRRDVTSDAVWSFSTPNTSVATINSSTGLLTGVAAGGPLMAQASFGNCNKTVSVPVTVAQIQSLNITPQFGSDPLISGNTERFDVTADLGGGQTQDVSLQSGLSSSSSTVASFGSGSAGNILSARQAGGPLTVSASLGGATASANVSVIDAVLQYFDIQPSQSTLPAPASADVQYPGNTADLARFSATGTYDNGQQQDVSRIVSWSSSDTTIAQISNQAGVNGVATVAGSKSGTVEIQAKNISAAQNTLATAKLDVLPASASSSP